MKNSVELTIIIGVLSLLCLVNCTQEESTSSKSVDVVTPLTKHWEMAIPHQIIPEGLTDISAKTCGACHRDIYNEWKQSTHALAFQDPQFQAEMRKDNVLVCLNCHTPLQDQQKFVLKGFINGDYHNPLIELNTSFDSLLQQESITCATCHVRNGHVIGTRVAPNAPHKMQKDTEFLSEKLCIGCHNVVDELSPGVSLYI